MWPHWVETGKSGTSSHLTHFILSAKSFSINESTGIDRNDSVIPADGNSGIFIPTYAWVLVTDAESVITLVDVEGLSVLSVAALNTKDFLAAG